MEAYKQEFIKFMVESDVLKFGSFTLKSGRQSPFFMNAGAYVTGYQLKKLGEYYAQAIHDNFGDDFDVLFGPAYKGIPLAVVTAIAYHELYGKEVKYCCDRKEAKDHGADKGNLLGYEPKDGDRVVMVEDVTTSGKSIDETYACLRTVPGIGPRTAAQLAVSVDIGRFPDHDHLASYCGIAPRVRSSGTSVRSVRASKRGDARLKSLLIFSCNSLVRSSGRYGEYYRACRARGMGHGRALKAVARKRLRAIYAVMRDRVPYRE